MKAFTLKMKSQGEFHASKRTVCGIDGLLKGTTKVQSRKGKKAYNRKNQAWRNE